MGYLIIFVMINLGFGYPFFNIFSEFTPTQYSDDYPYTGNTLRIEGIYDSCGSSKSQSAELSAGLFLWRDKVNKDGGICLDGDNPETCSNRILVKVVMWSQNYGCDTEVQIEQLQDYYYSLNMRNQAQKPHFLIGSPDLMYENYSINTMSYFEDAYRPTGLNIPFFIYSEFLSLPSTNHYTWSLIGSSKNSLINLLDLFKELNGGGSIHFVLLSDNENVASTLEMTVLFSEITKTAGQYLSMRRCQDRLFDPYGINCNTSSDCPYQKMCKYPILTNTFTTSFQRISYLRSWVKELKSVFADVLIVNLHYPLFREFLQLMEKEHLYYKAIINLESYQLSTMTLFPNELMYILLPFNPTKFKSNPPSYKNIGYYYTNKSEVLQYIEDGSRILDSYKPDYSIYGTLTGIIINEILRELPFSIIDYNFTYEEFGEFHDIINSISFENDYGKIQFNKHSHELNDIPLSLLQIKEGILIDNNFQYPADYDWIAPQVLLQPHESYYQILLLILIIFNSLVFFYSFFWPKYSPFCFGHNLFLFSLIANICFYIGYYVYVTKHSEFGCKLFYLMTPTSLFVEYITISCGIYMEIYHHIYSPSIIHYAWNSMFLFLFYFIILVTCIIFKDDNVFIEKGITFYNGEMEMYMICKPPKIYTSIIIGSVVSVLLVSYPSYLSFKGKLYFSLYSVPLIILFIIMNIISILFLVGSLIQSVDHPVSYQATFFINYFGNFILFIPLYYILFTRYKISDQISEDRQSILSKIRSLKTTILLKLFFIDTPLQNIINFYIEVEQYKTVSEHEIEKVGQVLYNKYLNTTSPEYLSLIPTERLLQITEQLESGGYNPLIFRQIQSDISYELEKQNFWEKFLLSKFGSIYYDSHFYISYFSELEQPFIQAIVNILSQESSYKEHRYLVEDISMTPQPSQTLFQRMPSHTSKSIYSRNKKKASVFGKGSSYYHSNMSFQSENNFV